MTSQNNGLENKVILIPGASRPLGRSIANLFGTKGASLVLPYYDWPESVTEMKADFDNKGFDCLYKQCDLRNEEEVKKLAYETKQRFDVLHYLVNNIERGGMPVVHGSYDKAHNQGQWDNEVATTLKAKWLLYHHFTPLIHKAETGSVLNITSVAAHTGRSGVTAPLFNDAYSSANRGVRSFTETWARENGPNIRVNELMLGLVQSRHAEGTRGWKALSELEKESILSHILLKRTATVEEVAETVFFLLCQATYITGTVIKMDGGLLLGGDNVPEYPEGIL